jgi:hypothetical protein
VQRAVLIVERAITICGAIDKNHNPIYKKSKEIRSNKYC